MLVQVILGVVGIMVRGMVTWLRWIWERKIRFWNAYTPARYMSAKLP
jgi:hypothetical protein